jgi:uncharacterized protein (TIGR04255 family)
MALNLPEPDRSELPKSPLELVVFQVRFENRLRVSEGAVALAFHSALGEGAYPDIDSVEGQAFTVTVGPAQAPTAESKPLSGWRMATADGKWAVALMPDHVAVETRAYTTWEEFEPRLAAAIDAAAEHVGPSLEQRVGLRFIDRITELDLRKATDWSGYIAPELLGVLGHEHLGPAVRAAHQQVLLEIEDGIRCGLRHGPIVDEERETVDYLLDYDLHRDGGRPFDADAIKTLAGTLNHIGLQLFQASVTPELLDLFRES